MKVRQFAPFNAMVGEPKGSGDIALLEPVDRVLCIAIRLRLRPPF
jgi:hypothetical protein